MAAPVDAGDLLAHLAALEAELHHPGRALARARLEQLLHPDFHEVGRSGRRYTREAVIDFLASGAARPHVVASGHRLQPLADGWALLHFHSVEITADGGRRHPALRASVWTHSGEGWRMYYHQGTPDAG